MFMKGSGDDIDHIFAAEPRWRRAGVMPRSHERHAAGDMLADSGAFPQDG